MNPDDVRRGREEVTWLLHDPERVKVFTNLGLRFLRVISEQHLLADIVKSLKDGQIDLRKWNEVESAVVSLTKPGSGARNQLEALLEDIRNVLCRSDVSFSDDHADDPVRESLKGALIAMLEEVMRKEKHELDELQSQEEGKHLWILEHMDRDLRKWNVDRIAEDILQGAEDEDIVALVRVCEEIIKLEDLLVRGESSTMWGFRSIENQRLFEILGQAADKNRRRVFFELSTLFGYYDFVCLLLAFEGDPGIVTERSINFAITKGYTDTLDLLLNIACIDYKDQKYLTKALRKGQKNVVRLLMGKGACINDPGTLLRCLEDTVTAGNLDIVQILLSLDIVKQIDTGFEILKLAEIAAGNGHVDLYRYLMIKLVSMGFEKKACLALSYKTKLPFSNVYVDYLISNQTRSRSLPKVGTITLDQRFMHINEITELPGYGNVQKFAGDLNINCSEFVNKVIWESVVHEKVERYKFFPLKIMRCGSSAEGTKVGLPDEMDFQFLLEVNLNELTVEDHGHSYKMLYSSPDFIDDRFWKGLVTLSGEIFHNVFLGLVMTDERHRDHIKGGKEFVRVGGRATTEWTIVYPLDSHPMAISIDRVPILHFKTWPSELIQKTWMMDSDMLMSEGYGLVAKPPHRTGTFAKSHDESQQQKIFTMSFSHIEAKHMAGLEQRVKDVYITCKSLRDPDICRMLFTGNEEMYMSLSKDLITSYMLKMVFMHNVEEFLLARQSLVEMVCIVYSQLALCLTEWFVPMFWNPKWNLLEGLKHDRKQCKQAAEVMKSLATARFLRDGETDTVSVSGGVSPYLPSNSTGVGVGSHSIDNDEEDSFEVVIYSRECTYALGYTTYQFE